MKKYITLILTLFTVHYSLFTLTSCTSEKKKVVAVSQCSMDEWRNQMNEEMLREAFFHKELDVEIHSTPDDTKRQIEDIESFISRKVDAIVVAPNEWEPLRPVIEKAYDAGIPVVLIDRKINSEKYTAFVGGDNVEVGRRAAHYIIDKLPEGGNIIEIEGLASSTSSQERKQGLHEVLDSFPQIKVVADVVANWKKEDAYKVMSEVGKKLGDTKVNIIFAYNDRMAIGAWQSFHKAKREGKFKTGFSPIFIGVDALLDDSLGIGKIEDGTIEASFLYQTGGDKAIHTAACILSGKPYERDQVFETSLVNKGNVHLMHIQANHIEEQEMKIEFLNDRLDQFFEEYSAQRIVMWTFILLALLACVLLVASIRFHITKNKLNGKLERRNALLEKQRNEIAEEKEKVERQRDELEAERDKLVEAQILSEKLKVTSGAEASETLKVVLDEPIIEPVETLNPQDKKFLDRFDKVIEKYYKNSEATVDMLGAEMTLGRVQLYRRIKALTGKSPNELLRETRLQHAKQLIERGELNVSEVAYDVGFSSPSYFAKCYKDMYGENPTESLKKK